MDHKNRVWIGGNNGTPIIQVKVSSRSDDMLVVFSNKGTFIRQIGRRDQSTGNDDAQSEAARRRVRLQEDG
ncbi:MAG: hypothetical protein ABL971_13545 [Vicinamibacterales bacterium]